MPPADYPFPDDEFDHASGHGRPLGVHRAPRTTWSRVWPFVVVLVVVPAVAWAAVNLFSGPDDGGTAAPTPPTTPTVTTPSEEPEPTPSEEPTPEPTAERGTEVVVLNAAGVQGLAGRLAEQAGDAGWTNVTADNYQGDRPETSTVYYAAAELEVTARALAEDLGVGAVELSADQPAPVTVVAARDVA